MIEAGYAGQILKVDLTNGEVTRMPLEEDLARAYIDGFGINAPEGFGQCDDPSEREETIKKTCGLYCNCSTSKLLSFPKEWKFRVPSRFKN